MKTFSTVKSIATNGPLFAHIDHSNSTLMKLSQNYFFIIVVAAVVVVAVDKVVANSNAQ